MVSSTPTSGGSGSEEIWLWTGGKDDEAAEEDGRLLARLLEGTEELLEAEEEASL